MDGRLWNKLYREIRHVGKDAPDLPRMGRPREYGTQDILAVWAFSAMMNWPISVTQHRLSQGATGWWLKRYWQWTGKIPCLATLTRRAKASDFRRLLRRLLRRLRRWQGLGPPAHVVIDSTFLLTGSCSRDPESRWACHGGKWFRGYALHVVCDGAGGLWAWHVSQRQRAGDESGAAIDPTDCRRPGAQSALDDCRHRLRQRAIASADRSPLARAAAGPCEPARGQDRSVACGATRARCIGPTAGYSGRSGAVQPTRGGGTLE